MTRLGVRPVMITGMVLHHRRPALLLAGVGGRLLPVDLVPGLILAGVGLGFSFVPVQIASLERRRRR